MFFSAFGENVWFYLVGPSSAYIAFYLGCYVLQPCVLCRVIFWYTEGNASDINKKQ